MRWAAFIILVALVLAVSGMAMGPTGFAGV
jgi:hypothetical protein